MPEKLSGGCACGAVRYECDAAPIAMLNCHCRDCQKASGGAFAAIVAVPKAALRLNGQPRFHRRIGNSGGAVERGFCANCGCPVLVRLDRLPDLCGLHAGSLDDPSLHWPALDVFSASTQRWDHMDPKTQKYPKAPPI